MDRNRPWSVQWPAEEELRRMVDAGMLHREIADVIGTTRQAVSMKLAQLGIAQPTTPRTSHGDYLPWTMAAEDHNDAIAHAMRAYSKEKQGGELTPRERSQADRLMAFMEKYNVVLNYDMSRGFYFSHRDRRLDKPGDVIRRPKVAK